MPEKIEAAKRGLHDEMMRRTAAQKKELSDRIDELEARVAKLEGSRSAHTAASTSSSSAANQGAAKQAGTKSS